MKLENEVKTFTGLPPEVDAQFYALFKQATVGDAKEDRDDLRGRVRVLIHISSFQFALAFLWLFFDCIARKRIRVVPFGNPG